MPSVVVALFVQREKSHIAHEIMEPDVLSVMEGTARNCIPPLVSPKLGISRWTLVFEVDWIFETVDESVDWRVSGTVIFTLSVVETLI